MHLPGRLTSVYLGDLLGLLHHHQKYRQLLPGLLPFANNDERLCQVGKGGGGRL
jgi:hypothetical protein